MKLDFYKNAKGDSRAHNLRRMLNPRPPTYVKLTHVGWTHVGVAIHQSRDRR